ncbi:MATE family efflux transporter [Telmatobacter bradus]|uniref:MATE family efflux transporter n=1 Tax=Telmatobacter bradus TaxID=474953 RepID=UPI003B43D412
MTASNSSGSSTLRRVVLLAFPLILSNLTQPLLASVDTILSGHLPSAAALGGVAMGGLFFNAIFWSFGFLRMGTTGLVAQAHGAGDEDELAVHVVRGFALALGLGLAAVLLRTPLVALALHLLGGSAQAQAQAEIYCRIRIWSAPAALANYVVLGTLLGKQRARSALLLQASIQVINIAVALGLVLGAHWAVAGIAAATLVAEWCGCLLGVALLAHTMHWQHLPWSRFGEREGLYRLFALNRDILLRTVSLVAAYGWFTRSGARAGDAVLAANAVLLNLQAIASYGLDGFANATEALVGEAIGAHNQQQYRAVLRASTQAAGLAAAVFSLLFWALGVHMVHWFTNQAPVADLAIRYLPWVIALPLIAVWGFQLDGVFIGATRSRDLRNSMIISLAGFLALSAVLERAMGNNGLWLAFTGFMALRGVTLSLRLKGILQHICDISAVPADVNAAADAL